MNYIYLLPVKVKSVQLSKNILISFIRSALLTVFLVIISWFIFVVMGPLKLSSFLDFISYMIFEKYYVLILFVLGVDLLFYIYGVNDNRFFKKRATVGNFVLMIFVFCTVSIILIALFVGRN